jgi:hypothetical protein
MRFPWWSLLLLAACGGADPTKLLGPDGATGGVDAGGSACTYTSTYGTCTFTSETGFTFTPAGATSPTTSGTTQEDPAYCSMSVGASLSCLMETATAASCASPVYRVCPTPLD